jgi:hypothetical protein
VLQVAVHQEMHHRTSGRDKSRPYLKGVLADAEVARGMATRQPTQVPGRGGAAEDAAPFREGLCRTHTLHPRRCGTEAGAAGIPSAVAKYHGLCQGCGAVGLSALNGLMEPPLQGLQLEGADGALQGGKRPCRSAHTSTRGCGRPEPPD